MLHLLWFCYEILDPGGGRKVTDPASIGQHLYDLWIKWECLMWWTNRLLSAGSAVPLTSMDQFSFSQLICLISQLLTLTVCSLNFAVNTHAFPLKRNQSVDQKKSFRATSHEKMRFFTPATQYSFMWNDELHHKATDWSIFLNRQQLGSPTKGQ